MCNVAQGTAFAHAFLWHPGTARKRQAGDLFRIFVNFRWRRDSCFLNTSLAVGPQLPPTRLEQFNRRARHITAQSMIVLAILGWILPILPGTPFFLLAWALGWRPPGSKHSVPTD